MRSTFHTFAIAATCSVVSAFPTSEKRATGGSLPDDYANHPFIAPQPDHLRSPCPGLNTLANHGYLPRDGMKITRQNLTDAFAAGFGVGQSVIDTPTANAFATCEVVKGDGHCDTYFDLTDLNRPHTFEHDHSMSRQDPQMLYAGDSSVDNHTFNRTMFGDTLQVIGFNSNFTVQNMQDIRIEREHTQLVLDGANNFRENKFTIETEQGFVMAVMRPFAANAFNIPQADPNNLGDQQGVTDWWMYWFSREQFPTDLGWRKPNELIQNDYVTGIRSSIVSATPTATPMPLPPGYMDQPTPIPVNQTPTPGGQKRGLLNPTNVPFQLATSIPGLPNILEIPEDLYYRAVSLAGPSPTPLRVYDIKYKADDFRSYERAATQYVSKLEGVVVSLVKDVLPHIARAEPTPTPMLI